MLFRRPRGSPAHFDRLFDLASGGLIVVDEHGRIAKANQAAVRIFSLPPENVTGRPIETIFGGPLLAEVHRSLATHGPISPRGPLVTVGLDGEGREFPIEVTYGPLEDAPVASWGFAVRDLREREALVQALTDRAARLARSNQDLQQFANIASHDLQEPLRMINSYTQLILRRYPDKLDDAGREFLGFMAEGAARMQELIDDLLAFARIESRGRPFATVQLEAVLAEAERNLTIPIRTSGAQITHDRLGAIEGDDHQLVELFQNLIDNAIKFRGPGAPRVHISEEPRGPEVLLKFRDNGLGIAPEYHEKIFEIFQRLHLPEEYPGTGIGLAVCKRVVERHGGRIWVESAGLPGEGSAFYVVLPRRQSGPPPPIAAEPATAGERRAIEIADDLIEERLRQLA